VATAKYLKGFIHCAFVEDLKKDCNIGFDLDQKCLSQFSSIDSVSGDVLSAFYKFEFKAVGGAIKSMPPNIVKPIPRGEIGFNDFTRPQSKITYTGFLRIFNVPSNPT
jgi:hypothetical protein